MTAGGPHGPTCWSVAPKVVGKLNEEAGKLTGDRSTEIAGKAQQLKGKAEEKIGELKRGV